jgi:gamma-glutamyl:cysteine ligase YbdK (ATP-grasp superfamily)
LSELAFLRKVRLPIDLSVRSPAPRLAFVLESQYLQQGMGLEIDREHFEAHEYDAFRERLGDNLVALSELLQRPDFGHGEATMGAEIEFSLVDSGCLPLPINRAVLAATLDPHVCLEIDRFNLELNTDPRLLTGRPFTTTAAEIEAAFARINAAALPLGGRIAAIGILPTLRDADLQSAALSDAKRYRALSSAVRNLRKRPFQVEIDGEDKLRVACDDVTLEGANTSFQVHLRVTPREFADTYNAAQIATAPVLAACGNSPIFLGCRLWEETRVALFHQAVDDREPGADWRPARVSFGHGWVREGIQELFTQSVALHEPFLPVLGDEDALACVRAGGVPKLDELRLHNGTIWSWNRPIYDPAGEGHLRIELRALPAGPSTADIAANTAVLVGLTLGMVAMTPWMTSALPFAYAHNNFYEAARRGLDAVLFWPTPQAPSPHPMPVAELIPMLLPVARDGLREAGVDDHEIDYLLGIFSERATSRMTGAQWQRRQLEALGGGQPTPEALARMLDLYLERAASGEPVHTWSVEAA